MIQIYGRDNSVNVQKVMWCADELGLPFERHDVGGAFGGTHDATYLAMNPNAKIPTLVDGDCVLWESNSIIRYLSAKYGDGILWPREPAVRGRADRWMDWQLTSLAVGMTSVFWGWVRTPPENRDVPALVKTARELAEVWRLLDTHLAASPYIGGDHFSMGDIPAGALSFRWHQLPIDRPDLPHLFRWYQQLQERPAFRTRIMQPMR